MLPQKYLCYSYNDSHSPPTSLVYLHMWSQVPTNPFNLTKLPLPPHSKTPSSLQKRLQRPFPVHGCEHKTRLSQSNHTVVQLKQSNRTARLSLRMGNTNTLKPFNRKFTSNCGNKAADGFTASNTSDPMLSWHGRDLTEKPHYKETSPQSWKLSENKWNRCQLSLRNWLACFNTDRFLLTSLGYGIFWSNLTVILQSNWKDLNAENNNQRERHMYHLQALRSCQAGPGATSCPSDPQVPALARSQQGPGTARNTHCSEMPSSASWRASGRPARQAT